MHESVHGWKAQIGLILPSPNVLSEPEFNIMKPEGVSVHVARVLLVRKENEHPAEGLKRMADYTEEAARLLATADVDIITYGCTSGSFVKGVGFDQEIISRIEEVAKIPATTTSTAMLRAFRTLGVNKIALATPYREEINILEKDFLEANGIKVLNMKGLGLMGLQLNRQLRAETMHHLAYEVNTSEAEAVYISCMASPTITIIKELEENLCKYVFSSNIVTMWDVLRRLGINEKIQGFGKLFEH